MSHRVRILLALAAVLALVLGLALERASRFEAGELAAPPGALALDRLGRPLRLAAGETGARCLPLPEGPLPPLVAAAFVAAEDKRFYDHPGIDVLAVARAAWQNVRALRVVSGASTITQQLARLAYPGRRGMSGKVVEMVRALRIEAALSKEEILRRYLDLAPMGHDLVGVQAGAFAYCGKPAEALTLAQAATLAALVKAPGRLAPDRGDGTSLAKRRNLVLRRMEKNRAIDAAALHQALATPTPRVRQATPFDAPHAVDLALAEAGRAAPGSPLKLTIDRDLERAVDAALASHKTRLNARGARQAAAVVVDNATLEVLALSGSLSYEEDGQGFVNGAAAPRSTGSTLKPFLYALALDLGLPASAMIEDTRRAYAAPGGALYPANFDRSAHGPVSLREALGNSLNLAAVRLCALIGIEDFFDTLVRLGLANSEGEGPDHYGLGMAVGNLEVRAIDLAAAYATLANGGQYRPARLILGAPAPAPTRVFTPQAAYIIGDMLCDPMARARSFAGSTAMNPQRVFAIKTGTSTHYRDAWAVGFSAAHTVAVWTGNFSGEPTQNVSGAQGAAPILADIFDILYGQSQPPRLARPTGIEERTVCVFSGKAPGENCPHLRRELFIAGGPELEPCRSHGQGAPWHMLPVTYSGWLFERHRHEQAGRYRLDGFGASLEAVFETTSPEHGPARTGSGGRGAVGIVSPPAGTTYLIGPRDETVPVKVQAESSRAVDSLTIYLDGLEAARVGPPFEAVLDVGRGRHTVTVAASSSLGESVEVVVQ